MQNDPHIPFYGLGLCFSSLEDAFERAHAHARATAPHDTGETEEDPTDDAPDAALLHGVELLCALREPIEWLLTLARRLAAIDPEEIAAVDRLRAAFHAALAGRAIGVRMQDAFIAYALLLSALDLKIVHGGFARCVADGALAFLTSEDASLARPARDDRKPASVPQTHAPRRRRGAKSL